MEEQVDYDHRSIMVEGGMQIDPRRERFPYCIVWTPLPITSWLIPFIGHIGICREDGVILDFAGPSCVSIDDFAFGAVARYIQINKDKVFIYVHLPPSLFFWLHQFPLVLKFHFQVSCNWGKDEMTFFNLIKNSKGGFISPIVANLDLIGLLCFTFHGSFIGKNCKACKMQYPVLFNNL